PGIVGFAKAVEIAQATMDEKRTQLKKYQQIVVDIFTASGIHFKVNGQVENGLPHVLNISFAGMDVESFLVNLDMAGVAVSSGSACTAGSIDPSHVLVAMFGKDSAELRNSIRFSFGYGLTDDTVAEAAKRTVDIVQRLANV
ncbi:MAG: aminotransferase class V-fold PLP-dependent enzyme, partial [Kurthia sp.]|nr:aminotransferase class V-fold PLP-dependent enzyme [Kurthia sp.]